MHENLCKLSFCLDRNCVLLTHRLYWKTCWVLYGIKKTRQYNQQHNLKGKLSDSFTNYNYVGNTKVSVSIKKT